MAPKNSRECVTTRTLRRQSASPRATNRLAGARRARTEHPGGRRETRPMSRSAPSRCSPPDSHAQRGCDCAPSRCSVVCARTARRNGHERRSTERASQRREPWRCMHDTAHHCRCARGRSRRTQRGAHTSAGRRPATSRRHLRRRRRCRRSRPGGVPTGDVSNVGGCRRRQSGAQVVSAARSRPSGPRRHALRDMPRPGWSRHN